jgi:hypothetical protein
METPKLQWSGAQVRDGVLTVEMAGERPKGYRQAFARTAKLLDAGRWSEIAYKAGTIRVGGVDEGSEESLRHFLESVIQEINTALVEDDDDHTEDGDDEREAPEGGDADARMTERFRAFDGD